MFDHGSPIATTSPFTILAMPFWQGVTRLGEAQILLPAALLALCVLLRTVHGRRLSAWWLGLLSGAVALTTATKIAFIGWGLGWQQIDFTGISGHAMFAAAVYPLLLGTLLPARPMVAPVRRLPGQAPPDFVLTWPWVGFAAGAALALLVGISRGMLNTHSASEVMAGLAVGGAVSVVAPWRAGLARGHVSPWPPALAALWLVLTPAHAPVSQSHSLVTRVALALSGHQHPYQRDAWMRAWRARNLL